MRILRARYDDPAVTALVTEALADLGRRYGGSGDDTPVEAADFVAPRGAFLVAEEDGGLLLGCAGWRAHGADAELKRLYVRPTARGRGLARRLLTAVEESARECGFRRLILECGDKQPEAVGLYQASGYVRIPDFGFYAGHSGVLSFARSL